MATVSTTPPKKLINEVCNIGKEFIDGLLDTHTALQHLEGFPEMKVVFRGDVYPGPPYKKVAVISGGGSGHEPAHAGFVGEGMLTAAICGNLFENPTVDAILAGIRAVTGPMGCLLIIMNYPGDRLKFGLAAEKAKSEGYKVETVLVGDDCARPPPLWIAGRRGLAGAILVHKVAGAAAAAGLSLANVAAEARHASENVGTMGAVLNVAKHPGMLLIDSLGPEKMELGLGKITGYGSMNVAFPYDKEPEESVIDVQPIDVVVSHLLTQILSKETDYLPIPPGDRVVLMVNGLGGTPLMELMIAAGRTVHKLQVDHGLDVDRVYTGSFMTSLDTEGFSISIMRSEPSILQRLDAETKAPYWPVAVSGNRLPSSNPVPIPKDPVPIPKNPVPFPPSRSSKFVEDESQPLQLTEQGRLLEVAIVTAATKILHMKDLLNEYDSKVGDGDCGSNMCRGAEAILEDIKNYPLNNAAETVGEIGSSIWKSMRGKSGIIYSIFCKAACAQLKTSSHSDVTFRQWAEALAAAIAAVSKYGGARAGDRTLLDALIPASSYLQEILSSGGDPISHFVKSSDHALGGALSTKNMQPQVGRLPSQEILSSVPDPGAWAAASWYKAAAITVRLIMVSFKLEAVAVAETVQEKENEKEKAIS